MADEGSARRKSKVWVWRLGIVAVLAGMGWALISQCNRAEESARVATCKNHLKKIGWALHRYASDHDDRFPPGETAAQVFSKLIEGGYLPNRPTDMYDRYTPYVCPSVREDVKAWKRTRKVTEETCSYEWMPGLSEESPPDFPLAFDKAGNHRWGGRNVLFVDGHVLWIGEEYFQERMTWQREMMKQMEEGGEYVRFEDWREAQAEK